MLDEMVLTSPYMDCISARDLPLVSGTQNMVNTAIITLTWVVGYPALGYTRHNKVFDNKRTKVQTRAKMP